MIQRCDEKAVTSMKSVMAASLSQRHRVVLFNNACILLRSFVSRPYHAAVLNPELLFNGKTFWRRRRQAGKCCRRCLSDNPGGQKRTVSLIFSRGPLRWISNKIKLFLVNSYFDADFEEEKFLEGAKQAVCTVSALVSQRKFSELEGLLTDEAIESLRHELSQVNSVEAYHITMEDILQTNIHDIGFQYDESEKGKKWLHVMVSYICRGNELPHKEVGNITFIRIPLPRITRYSFRKECTLGIEDSWIITKVINLNQDRTAAS